MKYCGQCVAANVMITSVKCDSGRSCSATTIVTGMSVGREACWVLGKNDMHLTCMASHKYLLCWYIGVKPCTLIAGKTHSIIEATCMGQLLQSAIPQIYY